MNNSVTAIFLSKISKIEFTSAALKKVRTNDITSADARNLLLSFESDYQKYFFLEIDNMVIAKATQLISIYGIEGLRTLDSIQLSTALIYRDQIDLSVTSDALLKKLMVKEKLRIYPTS